MIKTDSNKQLDIAVLSSYILPILLIIGTILVYFTARGYRIDFENQEIETTGTLNIKSSPTRAYVILDDKLIGKTPKVSTGLAEGEHSITIQKENYHSWSMDFYLEGESLIPIHIPLYLKETMHKKIFQIDADTELDQIINSENNEFIYFTTMRKEETQDQQQEESENNQTDQALDTYTDIEIWRYQINKYFWQFDIKPEIVYTLEVYDEQNDNNKTAQKINIKNYSILPSPNNENILIKTNINDRVYYYITGNLTQNENKLTELDLPNITEQDKISWSKDSKYLILEKENELRSINIQDGQQTIIIEKNHNTEFIWTSDMQGNLYYVDETKNSYDFYQVLQNGKQKQMIFRTYRTNINESTEETQTNPDQQDINQDTKQEAQDNTEDSKLIEEQNQDVKGAQTEAIEVTLNKLNDIIVSDNGNFMIIFSDNKLIVNNNKESTTDSYSVDNPEFIGFSPSQEGFLFLEEGNKVINYNIEIEENHPQKKEGPTYLFEFDENSSYSNFNWHPYENVIFYTKEIKNSENVDDTQLKLCVFYIYNKQEIEIDDNLIFSQYSINSERNKLYTFCQKNYLCEIIISE
ncbi:PEGA domain-containing protein [Candidatus Dojkabacteria bacterium]|nr:PEGA domain-containing protein [Candidatus Dojkabacteria bacterium]